jgi:hypothetical protein
MTRRDLLNAGDLAHALGGKSAGRGQWFAKCPAHQERTGSLSIKDDYAGVLVHCFAGCSQGEVIQALVDRGLWPRYDREERKRELRLSRPPPAKYEPDHAERTARALQFWIEALAPTGKLVSKYLSSRKISLPEDVLAGDAIRLHPNCPYQQQRLPCMLSLYSDTITGEPRAIHRIALTPDAKKIDKGMSLGPIGGCVVRLWPDEAVEQGLVIGEGIETVLATATCIEHRGTLLQPAWAAGCSGNLESFPVLSGIECLTILVDHDRSGTGQRAGEKCAKRWANAGRQVIRLVPFQPGSDFADIALEVGAA